MNSFFRSGLFRIRSSSRSTKKPGKSSDLPLKTRNCQNRRSAGFFCLVLLFKTAFTDKPRKILTMDRILIIGSPGSGKSTLGRKLSQITGIPLVYLDMIWHKSDGSHIRQEEFDQKLSKVIAQKNWIIDGNYARTLPERINACDTVIYLHYPTALCMESIQNRIGTKRPDLPWTETILDPDFRDYVEHFYEHKEASIENLLRKARAEGKTVLEFFSRSEADKWLSQLKQKTISR